MTKFKIDKINGLTDVWTYGRLGKDSSHAAR